MMTHLDIAQQRLHNQHLSSGPFHTPAEVVQWLGAVQSQDYGAAKWAISLRMQGATDDVIEQAVADGSILRTHIMRPTWHFVTPADIRWIMAITAPRSTTLTNFFYRQLELDEAGFRRIIDILIKALQGGKHLTRDEIKTHLEQSGINTNGEFWLGHLLGCAEMTGTLCSGARLGKQQTYALLDERAPGTVEFERDEALAELTRRYFTSHGPARVKDFVWWSGLTMADIKVGLDVLGSKLQSEVVDDQTYWFAELAPIVPQKGPSVYLLPNYDEYIVSYTDRSAIVDEEKANKLDPRGNILFSHTILIDGRIRGTWKRTLKKRVVEMTFKMVDPLTPAEADACAAAVQRYGEFLGLSAVIL